MTKHHKRCICLSDQATESEDCMACEGTPKFPNVPCAVCGRSLLLDMSDQGVADEEIVEVTQADREAAANHLFLCHPFSFGRYDRIDMAEFGKHDDHPLVQAFARHRTAALSAARPLIEAEVREKAAQVADARADRREDGALPGWTVSRARIDEARTIAAAIRSGSAR